MTRFAASIDAGRGLLRKSDAPGIAAMVFDRAPLGPEGSSRRASGFLWRRSGFDVLACLHLDVKERFVVEFLLDSLSQE